MAQIWLVRQQTFRIINTKSYLLLFSWKAIALKNMV